MTAPKRAGGCTARRAQSTPRGSPLHLHGPRPLSHAAAHPALRQRCGDEMHPRAQAPRGPRGSPDAGSPEGSGVTASFSRPRVSNDNPYSESLFRTLKTRFDHPAEGFASLERARACIRGLVGWHSHEHRHKASAMSRRCSADGARTKPSCSGARSCTERPARLIPGAGMAAGRGTGACRSGCGWATARSRN